MSKYNINECFGLRAQVTAPVNAPVVGFAGMALGSMHMLLEKIDGIKATTHQIEVENGQIDIHIIRPLFKVEKNEKLPCIMDLHGGGLVFDGAPHMYQLAARYALETGCVVAFPRYRLAPRNKYPTQINDCIAAYDWLKANADAIGIDAGKMAVMGDSAGGFLALAVVDHASELGDRLMFQLLIYPVVDTTMSTESMKLYEDTPLWNAKNNRSMWRMFFGKSDVDRASLSWLTRKLPETIPPTYIETAEFDCLHDEGLLYADRLREKGIDVEVNETLETMHGFDEVKCDITEAAVVKRIEFMKSKIQK